MEQKEAIYTDTAPFGVAEDIRWSAPVPQPASNDELPPIVSLNDELALNLPLSPELIKGTLRVGHKMIISGPSKAGKSFLVIALAIAIASGTKWLGRACRKGRVLYLNFELDRASCIERFRRVAERLNIAGSYAENLDIIHLRGYCAKLDKISRQIIERICKTGPSPGKDNYVLLIIDPLYKLLMGDENAATEMANFFSFIDKLCTELGCAVVVVHHHSKGHQGSKNLQDRSSGSGVLARDPDAVLDVSPLETTKSQLMKPVDSLVRETIDQAADDNGLRRPSAHVALSQAMTEIRSQLDPDTAAELDRNVTAIRDKASPTAWRVSQSLREFDKSLCQNTWFLYPVHILDEEGVLTNCKIPNGSKRDTKEDLLEEFEAAFDAVSTDGKTADALEIAKMIGRSEKTVERRVKELDSFSYAKHVVTYLP